MGKEGRTVPRLRVADFEDSPGEVAWDGVGSSAGVEISVSETGLSRGVGAAGGGGTGVEGTGSSVAAFSCLRGETDLGRNGIGVGLSSSLDEEVS